MPTVEGPFPAADVTEWAQTADVVVIGLGIAGACAALEAQRAGADVLVLERAGAGGGASALSQGQFYLGGGTDVQTACGYEDSPENMYAFLRSVTTTDEDAKLRVFCESSVEQFDWLESLGVPFNREAYTHKAVYTRTGEGLLTTGNEKVWPFRDQAAPAPRGHQVSGDGDVSGGNVAMRAVLGAIEAEQVPVIYEANVIGLVQDAEGRVVGVKMRRDGRDSFVQARKGVVLAAGSFNLNADITAEHMPLFSEYGKPLGEPTNDGAGLLLGRTVGVAERGMAGLVATASIYPPEDLIKGIVVNAEGRRFMPEDAYHGRMAHTIARQPGARAFLIVDEEIFGYPKHGSHTFLDAYETVDEMEAALSVPAGSLVSTLDRYNADVAAGEDAEFHKHPDWLKELKAPYAVFDISIPRSDYHWMSLGGLVTDEDGRALHPDGTTVPGLYAAGACTNHLAQDGDEYASGMSLAAGSIFGRRAGAHAAAS
ncbi:MAG: FAD-dependent oxidoreductase [Actinomycetales bacterium]|nr:FAD-dependent oxidoreductase [Actinomycetales bacterium]